MHKQNREICHVLPWGDITEEKEYHDKWVTPLFNRKIMIPSFGKKVCYKKHPKVGVYGFYIFNEDLVRFFERLGVKAGPKTNVQIPPGIINNKNLAKRFLRGLFDTDGNIYFDKNRSAKKPKNDRACISLTSVSKRLINQTFAILKSLGLNPRIRKPYKGKRDKNTSYCILIYRKKDVERFIKEIEFKNSKHYTKWKVFKKLGYCLPHTSIAQRKKILEAKAFKV